MGLDRFRMMEKIGYISSQIEDIRTLLAVKRKEEILADPWVMRGLKYSLQTAVEAVIDLAYHIAAKKYGVAPTDARDALRVLGEHGLVKKEKLAVFSAMVGFRNRLVHGYQEVSPQRVYEIALHELGDLEEFVRSIVPLTEGEDG